MKKNADPDDVVDAVPVGELESVIDKYDVILLGPQIRFKEKDVKKLAELRRLVAAAGLDVIVLGLSDLPAYDEPAEDGKKKRRRQPVYNPVQQVHFSSFIVQ